MYMIWRYIQQQTLNLVLLNSMKNVMYQIPGEGDHVDIQGGL